MIYEKLMNIQQELSAPKSQRNDFGKYNYRSCEDVLEALKPLLLKNKAVVFFNDEIKVENGRSYILTTLTFCDAESGEVLKVSALAREEESKKGMDGSQVTGASSSYARKYALNGMFAIDDNKDSDATNKGEDIKAEPKKPDTKKAEPNKADDSIKFTCSKCGKVIQPYFSEKLKKNVSLREHAESCNKAFGSVLCLSCIDVVNNASRERKS